MRARKSTARMRLTRDAKVSVGPGVGGKSIDPRIWDPLPGGWIPHLPIPRWPFPDPTPGDPMPPFLLGDKLDHKRLVEFAKIGIDLQVGMKKLQLEAIRQEIAALGKMRKLAR